MASLDQVLEEIEDALSTSAPRSRLSELSSRFYTIVPHDFGRRVPPVIMEAETLQKKFDMLLVLGDIEMAQGLKRDKEKREKEVGRGCFTVCGCKCATHTSKECMKRFCYNFVHCHVNLSGAAYIYYFI